LNGILAEDKMNVFVRGDISNDGRRSAPVRAETEPTAT
jgi:hypothetical protein